MCWSEADECRTVLQPTSWAAPRTFHGHTCQDHSQGSLTNAAPAHEAQFIPGAELPSQESGHSQVRSVVVLGAVLCTHRIGCRVQS